MKRLNEGVHALLADGVNDHARGFGDRDEVRVLVDDDEALGQLLVALLLGRRRHVDDDGRARRDVGRLARDGDSLEGDPTLRNEVVEDRPRAPRKVDLQVVVEAHAVLVRLDHVAPLVLEDREVAGGSARLARRALGGVARHGARVYGREGREGSRQSWASQALAAPRSRAHPGRALPSTRFVRAVKKLFQPRRAAGARLGYRRKQEPMRARKTGNPRARSALEAGLAPPTGIGPARLTPRARTLGRLPLVVALVPDPDVWRVAGAGRTLVARRRPDGRVAWASLAFDLKRPDATRLFGHLESDEGAFEEILDALSRIDDAPPMIGGSESLASRFTRGALAYAREGACGPADEPGLLAVFDRGRTSEVTALEAFAGDDGLCPPELLAVCREEAAAGLEPGRGLATQVCLGFRAADGRLLEALGRDRDFVRGQPDGERVAFAWKPTALGGARAGSVFWLAGGCGVPAELEAETVSLDLAGKLCARIKRLAPGAVSLARLARQPLG